MDILKSELLQKINAQNKGKYLKRTFSLLISDEEKNQIFTQIFEETGIKFPIKNTKKSVSEAIELNKKATEYYISQLKDVKKMNLNETIKMYTLTIARAPANSYELSLAYANRSLVLFKARLYTDCINDIERALAMDYPEKSKAKLYARKARCLMILKPANASQKVKDVLEEAAKWLEKMDLNDNGINLVKKTIKNPKKLVPAKKEFKKLDDERNLPEIPNDNAEIPGASSAIKLMYSSKFGRHIVATRDIKPGEILAVNQPYASVIFANHLLYNYCMYCLKQTWAGIPCEKCVYAIFCSETCRQAAWSSHHEIECQVVSTLIDMGMDTISFLNLRILISAVKEAGCINTLIINTTKLDILIDPRTRGFTGRILDDKRYASVYTLMTNTSKLSFTDIFVGCLNAVYIAFVLAKQSNIFGNISFGDLKDYKKMQSFKFIAALLLKQGQILRTNFHLITEQNHRKNKLWFRGIALMPLNSLFNHSCNPSVRLISFGRKIATVAARNIKANQQIFVNYGFHCTHLSNTNARLKYLTESFFFKCACEFCTDASSDHRESIFYLNQNIEVKAKNEIFDSLCNYNKYWRQYMLNNEEAPDDNEKALEEISNILYVMNKHIDLHSCPVAKNILILWSKLYDLRGNRYLSVNN